MDAVREKLLREQEEHSTHMDSKEAIEAHLQEAAERKAAIDQEKSDLAGQEVAFAKAAAAERAEAEGKEDFITGLTREDIERDLEEAAERKKKIDEARSRKAGEEVQHVLEVVEKKKKSVEALESEKIQLEQELKAMEEKQKELERKLGA